MNNNNNVFLFLKTLFPSTNTDERNDIKVNLKHIFNFIKKIF